MNESIKPLLDLKVGDWITDGFYTFQWLGKMQGTKGCWKCDAPKEK